MPQFRDARLLPWIFAARTTSVAALLLATGVAHAAGPTQAGWRYQSSKPLIGGIAVTGGDVVFAGEITGDFLVLEANDGKVVYKHDIGGPIAGGMVSYASGGKQYVAAVSGFVGGYYNQMAPEIGGGNPTITVFALKP